MDPVGLSVVPASAVDGKIGCMDFRAVTTKNNKHAKRMEYNEMTVVYPATDTGLAYRFVIEYNTESDEVTVMTRGDYHSKVEALTGKNNVYWDGGERWY